MSLLDDVSIVVTPNGYKAGELYAVVPVPTEGAEKILNTDFATDSNWTPLGGWSISGGTANCNGASIMFTNASIIATKIYKITYTVSGFISGGVKVRLNGSPDVDGLTRTANGTYTEYITSSSSPNGNFSFAAVVSFVGSIDNVSVKEYTAADMDVTRETAATRVDEAGLVNYAEIVGDEEVTNGDFVTNLDGWILSASTPPTWDNGMIKMQSDGATFSVADQSFSTISGKLYTFVFEKLINNNTVEVKVGTSQGGSSLLNLTPTTIQTYTYSFIATSSTSWIRARDGSGTTGAYLSGFSVKEVTRDNVPRIDYTGGGCPHILAEPQRTNKLTYSENFANGSWINNSIGTTPILTGGFNSPDGTNNAYKISNANQDSMWYLPVTIGASDSRTIYARTVSGTGTAQLLSHNSNTNNTFNLTEEWQRFEVSTTTSGIGASSYYAVDFRGSGTLTEILIWGGQAESGSFPTSYIPTSGSTVTRNKDIFTRDGIGSLINSTEGVLFVEMAAISDDLTRRKITISDGTLSNFCSLYFDSISNKIIGRTTVGGVLQSFLSTSSYTETNFNKVAFKWKVNDFALWVNGSEVGVDSSGVAWGSSVLTEISFDNGTGAENFYGKVKQLQVYKTALTDAQLTSLTS